MITVSNINLKPNSKLIILDEVISRRNFENNFVIMNFEIDGKFIQLSGLCAEVWNLMQSGQTYQELLDSFFDKYDAPVDLAKEDIYKFINTLEQNKIISINN